MKAPIVNPRNIPAELQDVHQFVTWIWPQPDKKLPCSVATGEVDDATNPAIYGSFQDALTAYRTRKHAGIGFALTETDDYTGIDLDACVQDGKITHPDALAIVALSDWWDISPTATGLKTIVRGHVPSSAKGKTPGGLKVEIYPANRFFTLTGRSFEGRPATISAVNGELTDLYRLIKPHGKPKAETPRPLPSATADADHSRRYALAALDSERQAMLAAGEGERHNTRCKAAYALAGYIPHITAQEIFDALAVNFGADQRTAEKTIWDGIEAGQDEPRDIPPPAQPTFDADGHACCPTDGKRLVACFNGHGWRCPTIGDALCFWWNGDGYTPPADIAIDDDLDSLSPDELRRRLRAVAADRDRWKARAEQLDAWRDWALQIAAIPTERVSPAAKVVALSLYPEFKSRESRGVAEPQRVYIGDPKKKDGAAVRAGLSPGTYGAKLKELKHVGALLRTEDRQADGKKMVLIQPAAFLQPATWAPPEPRNHGGHHPKEDRPAPACPTHGEDAPIVEETTETWLHVCGTCEKPLNAGQRKPRRRTIWDPTTQIAGSHDDAGGDDTTTQLARKEKTEDFSPTTQVAGSSSDPHNLPPGDPATTGDNQRISATAAPTLQLAAGWLGKRNAAGDPP